MSHIPTRLMRAQKLLTEAMVMIESHVGKDADDVDLHQAIHDIDRAKMILAKRIDAVMPK